MDEKFIEDPFNLIGLSSQIPLYRETLEVILDLEPNDAMYSRVPDLSLLQPSAELLYGLIHQRYIITKDGLLQMVTSEKGFIYLTDVFFSWKNTKRATLANVQDFIVMIATFYLADSMIHQSKVLYAFTAQIVRIFIHHRIQSMLILMVNI